MGVKKGKNRKYNTNNYKKITDMRIISTLLMIVMAFPFMANANTWLTFDSSTKVDMTYGSNSEYCEMVTTGTDPHIVTYATGDMHLKDVRLEFYYQSSEDIDDLQLFFRDPESESRSAHFRGLLTKTSEWKFVSINLATYRSQHSWGGSGSKLRMDFGNKSGVTIKIKNIGIFGHVAVSDATKQSQSRAIERYLAADYASEVSFVKVTEDKVIIRGNAAKSGYRLAGVTSYGNTFEMTDYEDFGEVPAGDFEVTVDRYSQIAGYNYDRLLSKFVLYENKGGVRNVSHAHYADEVKEIRHAEPAVLKSKKGLGMPDLDFMSEIDDLGLSWVTYNIMVNTLVMCNGSESDVKHEYGGKTYYINGSTLATIDSQLKTCEQKGVMVAAIILIHPNGGEQEYATALSHPEYTSGGIFSMPDVTTIYGTEVYAATIDFLANRYSQSGNGRIHHWIMHNETDQNLVWTNMGKQPIMRYVDTYEKSMRLVSNIVRQYDQNAYVLGSFTSSWNTKHKDTGDAGFPAKNMIDNMLVYSGVEGDYRWGVAAHVYPQDFYKPEFWKTDTEATYSEGSGFSTFKNIEVISDWMLRREHYYQGKEKRMLFFSENGVNAMDNSSYYLKVQAAGAAWAWKKIVKNAGVDAALWHNWRDNSAEGGLKLGLRYENNTPKPAWYVWQAAGTANEDNVFNQYLSVIGVSSWDQIHHGVSATGDNSYRLEFDQSSKSGLNCSYDGTYQYYTITSTSGDPNMKTQAKGVDLSDNSNSLEFEYQLNRDIDFQVFISTNGLFYEERSVIVPLNASSEWKKVSINMAPLRKQWGWGAAGTNLRIDFGGESGTVMKMRHLCMNSGLCMDNANIGTRSDGANQCSVSYDVQRGETTIVTSDGGDPFFYTTVLESNLSAEANTLMFEYQSSANITEFRGYFVDYAAESRSINFGNLSATSTWKKVVVDISSLRRNHGWGYEGDYIRLDPGTASGVTIKIRNICINKGEYTSTEYLTLDNLGSNHVCLNRDTNTNPEGGELEFGDGPAYFSWTINSIGNDPFVRTNPLSKNLNSDATKLYLEYTSTTDIEPFEVYFLSPETETRCQKYYGVMPSASEWTKLVVDISEARNNFGWGNAGDVLRIDLGDKVSQEVKLRRIAVYNGKDNTESGVEIEADDSFSVTGTVGGIVINSSKRQMFTIHNVTGVAVRKVNVEGVSYIPMTSGIYIVNGKKVVVR